MCYELMTHPLFSIKYLFFGNPFTFGFPFRFRSVNPAFPKNPHFPDILLPLSLLPIYHLLPLSLFQYVLFIRNFFVQYFSFIFLLLLLLSEVRIYFEVDGNQEGD